MDPEVEVEGEEVVNVEELRIKVRSMMNCVCLARAAAEQFGISNSITSIPRVRLSIDSRNSKELLKQTRQAIESELKDLVNKLLQHLGIASFSFLCPECEVEVYAMEVITHYLLCMSSDPDAFARDSKVIFEALSAAFADAVTAPAPTVVSPPPASNNAAVDVTALAPLATEGSNAPAAVVSSAPATAGVTGWLEARWDRFTKALDSVMAMVVLCGMACMFGHAAGVLCLGVVLGCLLMKELKNI